ncbi:MAG: hypothetical protein ACR2P5_09955 [Gammaproteobacteria bacterium]
MNYFAAARECFRESARIYWTLLKISLPLIAAIRVLDEYFNFVARAGEILAPVMSWMDLPGQAGIVWATAIFLQLYAAMLVLASLWTQLELTSAQATTLAAVILTAHALPVELRIAQKAGVKLRAMLALRIGGALCFGAILAAVYQYGGWLQEPATLHFTPPPPAAGWGAWLIGQAKNWALIYAVILLLVIFIRILKETHAEKVLIILLAPFLRKMGIGAQASTITIVGITLGLSYGGGLLIRESQRGDINRRDMLCALALLCLCHSVIEDTLAMMLVGAHISGVLFGRIIFAFAVMFVFAKIVNRMPDSSLTRWFLIAR